VTAPGPIVVFNRGPVSFAEDGSVRRGAGGVVSTLVPALGGLAATWISAAMTPGDRAKASSGTIELDGGLALRLIELGSEAYSAYYDVIANRTLWFAHHGLDDKPRSPSIDRAWHEAWDAYVAVNETFAEMVIDLAPERATVLVQDLHLSLVGGMLAAKRPDLRTSHFSHTPFAWPSDLSVVPAGPRRQLLQGLAGHGVCGFHSARWAHAFLACCAENDVEPPAVLVAPAAIDPSDMQTALRSEECRLHQDRIDDLSGERKLIVRVDRMELSKNILRGFSAYDLLLAERTEWHDRVVFVACCYPSREGLPEYRAYRDECIAAADAINDRWGTATWTPVQLMVDEGFPRSVAALSRADVCLVNPVRDGLNVVAKELTVANDRDAVLCLSPEAGVWDELGGSGAVPAPPFDIQMTADALHEALSMGTTERAERFSRLKAAALGRTPKEWLGELISASR
jgi:trehalose 6-phosphate synthase